MKIVLIAIGVVGLVAGMIFGGVIKIPGFSQKPAKPSSGKGSKPAPNKDATVAEAAPPAKEPTVEKVASPRPETLKPPKKEVKPTIDESKGDKKLAIIFNEMDAGRIKEIVDKWNDEDLARLLAVMDNAKVVEVLGQLKAERASAIVKQIQKLSSVVPATAAG